MDGTGWAWDGLSRRRLLVGAAVLGGAALCSHPRHWARALAADGQPVPIPGQEPGVGLPPNAHVYFPGPGREPSTIYNFRGLVAVTEYNSPATDQAGNAFIMDNDIRVYSGEFVSADGARNRGTFAFIWVDLYKGAVAPDNQVNDFNPGISSSGVFWTVPIPRESVRFTPEDRTLVLDARDVAVLDHGNVVNALTGQPGVPSTVTLRVEWHPSALTATEVLRSDEDRFAAILHQATIASEVAVRTPSTGFAARNDPATVNTMFAVMGMERNGSFFPSRRRGG